MFNYTNLSDYEFEVLCRDVMEKKLGMTLRCFAPGRDGGVDITENELSNRVVIQVKHYINTPFPQLMGSLKKEVTKVCKMRPEHYYVCCAKRLTAGNIKDIYALFADYMEGPQDVIDLGEIDKFLHQKENADILEQHYKLWLESTNILEQIYNQDVFVDCESLLDDMQRDQQRFVKTSYYDICREILEKDRMLLLLGDPGAGKTMTSKMLTLYFAAKGYRIRYTTNNDISDLKAALSRDKDRPEVLLLDDCLGQHYFKMQDTRESQLLALMKYIRMNPQKILIMNSRVTIFKEAKERSSEFRYFMDDEKLKIRKIEMKELNLEEKGQIFYNHLYFSGVPEPYWQDIRTKRSYHKIVRHRNYTPRIIEFVTKKSNYSVVAPENFSEYILSCLNNPQELWKDEFCSRIAPEDRALMLTLYSLTDTMVEEPILIRAYKKRIAGMQQLDTTRNIYQESLKRLTDSMLRILEDQGVRKIGVCNPSVNDFLKNYIAEQRIEVELPEYATEFVQILRICPQQIDELVRDGAIYQYHFKNDEEKCGWILPNICRNHVKKECHRAFVEEFMEELPWCTTGFGNGRISILMSLLTDEFDTYYHTWDKLNEEALADMFEEMDLDDYDKMLREIKEKGRERFLVQYRKQITAGLQNAVDEYIVNAPQGDYYGSYDTDAILDRNICWEEGVPMYDFGGAAEEIAEQIQEDICEDVWAVVNKYPVEISMKIQCDEGTIEMDVSDIELYLKDYCTPDLDEGDFYDRIEDRHGERTGSNVLDVMFQ